MPDSIAVTYLDESRQQYAEKLAIALNLDLVTPTTKNYPILLTVTPVRIELRLTDLKAPGPVYVDFLKKTLDHRRLFKGDCTQLITRAVKLKPYSHLNILDLTAGLGRDALILATLGYNVTMLERNPIIATLLKEGLARAQTTDWFKTLKLKLVETEAQSYLLKPNTSYDVIYMDPMYPIRKKSALVKKEMRVLRHVVGQDEDAPQLLEIALKKAKYRVVVKRPRLALTLTNTNPTIFYTGKSSRFDVYII
ncbi:class I SAM-dependent methyltransferase [Coxiella endosymbiont of Rhipicephalus microplus]|uniref:class I SAM-dependent methyltransferase n=1 Tax=Coxiella endosymbiont of Rhipicephalus microplus TaxID=1656186 RepID=UPI000C80DA84|nr:class I SAM-dependent methyltransferase [Coxiella endosymbiont of Rhipicephalus microplus]PMB54792.1 SAM-dependent methyltransferase [Coxiella-like endosymbiont]